MKKNIYLLALIFFSSIIFIACEKDEDEIVIPKVSFENINYSLNETDTSTLNVKIVLDTISLYDLTINFTVSGTAEEDKNYEAINYTSVLIAHASKEAIINIKAKNKIAYEGDKTIEITLKEGDNYLLASENITSTITIIDSINPNFKTVTLGAQANTVIDGFYSFNNEKTYTLAEAAENQGTIDLFCFYEADRNDITLSSPGANIIGIFDATYDPSTWTVQDTTYFFQVDETVFTSDMLAALTEESEEIETLFDDENQKRKAKLLQIGDIYAFRTEDEYHGLFLVDAVTQGESGSVTFFYIIKK